MQLITHSKIQCFKTCQRKCYFQYVRRIRPLKQAKPLYIGSIVHEILDQYKAGLSMDEAIDMVLTAYPEEESNRFDLAMITALMKGYEWRWQSWPLTCVVSEAEFTLPLLNPITGRKSQTFMRAGKVDGITVLPNSRLALLEHKTSSEDISVSSLYWKRLRIDGQISNYWTGAQGLGYPIETILYDVIRKPDLKPLLATPLDKRKYKKDGTLYANQREQDETPLDYANRIMTDIEQRPDYYYARRDIPRLPEDIEEYQYELWQTCQMLHDCTKHQRWPRNDRACVGFGTCSYFDLCTAGFGPQSDYLPEGFYIEENEHPELENQ